MQIMINLRKGPCLGFKDFFSLTVKRLPKSQGTIIFLYIYWNQKMKWFQGLSLLHNDLKYRSFSLSLSFITPLTSAQFHFLITRASFRPNVERVPEPLSVGQFRDYLHPLTPPVSLSYHHKDSEKKFNSKMIWKLPKRPFPKPRD